MVKQNLQYRVETGNYFTSPAVAAPVAAPVAAAAVVSTVIIVLFNFLLLYNSVIREEGRV